MTQDDNSIDLRAELEALFRCITEGDTQASVHLARVIEADTKGAFQPFAEVLTARLCDHLDRYAELGVTDSRETLEDEVYNLIRNAAVDWDGLPKSGRPGEEA